ncbi:FAD-binding protein [Adlercreutzia equolifaciens]|uniref:FAD-binding protein n=1 Tax=Adlercreutzia equolifaciens TaxID=446660 RepID=UPI0003897645|nr:FAD-binding protein [Adlercreutzia equolifaciens]RFT84449.1 FAD-binding protein [Adlercreutzia equolifaciens]BAN76888.1 fumarate reductase/succinate dehydrogenase flavoprotein domain-containing protein [Adlercreutzia equolifaciens DSM 19450]
MERMQSRRSFLMGAGAAAAAVAGGALAGCAPSRESEPRPLASSGEVAWDDEAEVVIVGAGTSLPAAMAAAKEGHRVVVMEKDSHYGGTMFLSDGGWWIPNNPLQSTEDRALDAPDDVLEYMRSSDLYGVMDEGICRDFLENTPSVVDYLLNRLEIPLIANPLHLCDYNDWEHWGYRVLSIEDWQSMVPLIDSLDIDFRFGTEAIKLVTNNAGEVTDVVGISSGKQVAVKATCGVLLAAGGFDHNEEMRRAYLRGPLVNSVAIQTNTGDGHRMGVAVGGRLMNMASAFTNSAFCSRGGEELGNISTMDRNYDRARPHSIIVNSNGRRFMNEGGSYDNVGTALFNMEIAKRGSLVSPATFICDSQFIETYGYPCGGGEQKPDLLTEYESLEALAEGEGIDKDRFLEEVERFNSFCETGTDRDFHRGESNFELFPVGVASLYIVQQDGVPNQYLGTLSKPPFYAAKYGAGSWSTAGGLMVDEHARVLGEEGPIVGLYASGCNAASFVSGYPGPGIAVFSGVYRALRAVNHALDLGIV